MDKIRLGAVLVALAAVTACQDSATESVQPTGGPLMDGGGVVGGGGGRTDTIPDPQNGAGTQQDSTGVVGGGGGS